MKVSKELELAVTASINAGNKIMEIYDSIEFKTTYKIDNSPLTQADILSNEIICNILKQTGLPILSEENSLIPYKDRKNWKKFWLVDPLDGTKEFINKNGEFTVNISMIENKKPKIGVVYCPVFKELFYAESKKGSYKCTDDFKKWKKNSIKIEKLNSPNAVILISKSHKNHKEINYIKQLKNKNPKLKTVKMGSSLKLCRLAEGKAMIYPRLNPTMEWDTAAAHKICDESCVKLTDLNGKELLYNKEILINEPFLATYKIL